MTTVVNQYGKFLDGDARQAVIDAVSNDLVSIDLDGIRVDIVKIKKSDKETTIQIEMKDKS